jgi:hypothetical protein
MNVGAVENMRAVADGEMALDDAKDISAILDSQRRNYCLFALRLRAS